MKKKEPGISYKRFSMDKDWTTLKPLLSEEPKGNPVLVRFDWAKQNDLTELRKELTSCSMLLTKTATVWWNKFLDELEKKQRYIFIIKMNFQMVLHVLMIFFGLYK